MTQTLTDFLRERIGEDENRQRRGLAWHEFECAFAQDPAEGDCDCGVPARVFADCEAKRRIMKLHTPVHIGDFGGYCKSDGDDYPCLTLLDLASVYADHPDFQPEWRII